MKIETKTQHFRDLLVWQKSMALAKDVYKATILLPKDEMFGLRSQMRRAAVSVPSNIAEGHGRLSDHLLRVFLTQARGSLYELETQIQLSQDLQFLPSQQAEPLMNQCKKIARMLNGLLAVLQPKKLERLFSPPPMLNCRLSLLFANPLSLAASRYFL